MSPRSTAAPSAARRGALLGWTVLVLLSGCALPSGAEPAGGAPTGVLDDAAADRAIATAPPGSALAALADVEVRGRAPRTGYEREHFGDGWVDTDRNGCDTRNDVLARDLTGEAFRPGTNDCVVVSGTLADPYSGRTIEFRRGEDTSDDVQIDHVVALSDAWQKGAQGWGADRRTDFANDPLNLLAVDGPLNMQKGDGDAATWLPPHASYRCAYVARQVAVKTGYGLWATRAERNAAATVLAGCPAEPLPGGAATEVAAEAAPLPVGTGYADCDAVRAVGAAPIRRGAPGWTDAFDGDGDGIGCE
ncbi:GmrSD restriction endonuclease domain-containing protein [Geodermatophilus sp. SYSU D01176]